jgi:DNA-binding beta-propeller fold protein YncE
VIADSENHVIRRVDRVTGIISTIAGAGAVGAESQMAELRQEKDAFQPMGEDPLAEISPAMQNYGQSADLSGTVRYVINGTISRDRFSGDGGPATEARLNFPTAVVVDGQGNLYIADTMNHRVRVVDADTGMMTTLAGIGQPRYSGDGGPAVQAGLNEPAALALDGRGTLYVADQSNNRVRAINLAAGLIRTVAGIGSAAYNGDGIQATEAALAGPSGVACAEDGTLFIADTFNDRIRAIDPATGLIRTVVGDGRQYRYEGEAEPPSVSLSRPCGIAVGVEGDLFMTDSDNHLVRRWNRITGLCERVAGAGLTGSSGDGGPALRASLNYPFGIAVGRQGQLIVADTFNHRIRSIAQ